MVCQVRHYGHIFARLRHQMSLLLKRHQPCAAWQLWTQVNGMHRGTKVVGRTYFLDKRVESILCGNRYDQDLDWSDQRWQGKDTTIDVGVSGPVAMFQECIEDTAQAERRFDDIGCEILN